MDGCTPPAGAGSVCSRWQHFPELVVVCVGGKPARQAVPLLPLAPLGAERKTAEGEEKKEEPKKQRLF